MEARQKRRGGGGRGRGARETQEQQVHNGQDAPPRRPGGQQAQLQKKPGGKMNGVESTNGGSRTFQEASAEIQANLQRHLAHQASVGADSAAAFSSSEDEGDDPGGGGGGSSSELVDKLFGSYDLDGDRTRMAVLGSLQKGGSSCLICISSIKKQDPIWSCGNCSCSFHLTCIQRWAKDSIFQQKSDQEHEFPDLSSAPPQSQRRSGGEKSKVHWGCPKCRHPHSPREIPSRYECYCGKVADPPFDPWILPHSCGEPCGKKLKPECGHTCLLLCHPGPCPPCPKMVTSACHCTNSAPSTRRCYDRAWSCGKPCGRTLNCGQHPCPLPCHEGECQPCQKTSVQLCQCRRKQQQTLCATPEWRCEEKCGKKLGCGHHMCDLVCHSGECPPCPLSEVRRCPCGKSTYKLPCTLATPTCDDTCGKLLPCGKHTCTERCHRGACGVCVQVVTKVCRCGAKKKEVRCTKEYICDLKCKRQRDCRKHTCNRKCCDGECPPCEQGCGRNLSCKNHKCASRCHQGSCYPCNQTKEVSCNCGASRLLVPCGREKATQPPRCRQKCEKPTECHHEKREAHRCHFGPCPTCKQVCDRKMSCGHSCPAPCHDKVKVTVNANGPKASVPWEERGPRSEVKTLDCPDCQHPVPVTCLGGHETADWPCHAAKAGSCGRKCGRRLPCGNHTCQRDCHRVRHAPAAEEAGVNCRKCEVGCQRERPDGCSHPCPRACHPGECEQCKHMVRIWCHCGLTQLYVKCGEWTTAEGDAKVALGCCQNQCPKILSCGHRCTKTCHDGKCSDPSSCRKKTKLFCPCKRRKEERPCGGKGGTGGGGVQCDSECDRVRSEARTAKEAEEKRIKEAEERQQREELERFEKKMEGRRKRRDRRHRSETVEEGFFARHKVLLVLAFIAASVAVAVAFFYGSGGGEPSSPPSEAAVKTVADEEAVVEIEDEMVGEEGTAAV